jgi:uncharacterized protein YeaO (DUF488 family)
MTVIQTKRVYEPATHTDGTRFLVERLWPRGVKKAELDTQTWLKEVAPSTGLRRWFAHDPSKWSAFKRKYFAELNKETQAWTPILQAARHGNVTLLYSSRDTQHNSAVALKAYLDKKMSR